LQPVCLLLQLSRVGFMEAMQQVLEHPNIIKVSYVINMPDSWL
jgi:hypothetical protein